MPAMTAADLPDTVDCGHAPQPTFYSPGHITVGHEIVPLDGTEVMFPGYAILPGNDGIADTRVCPDCADRMQREEMRTAQRFGAYVSSDGKEVTTWTGGKLGRITSLTRNRRQTFVHVVDVHGNHWAGIGPAESGTYTNLRRVKG